MQMPDRWIDTPAAGVATRQDQAETPSSRVKILIVDDDAASLTTLSAVLEDLGEEIVRARSGREALAHLLQDDFAVILLDVKMPEMDGFETAELIRQRKRSQRTPILFLTGYQSDGHLFRGYGLGAVDFLVKPVIPEVLRSKVAVFVEFSRLNRELENLVQDRTARQRATERELMLLIEASGALLESPTTVEVVNTIMALAQRFVESDAYAIWRKQGGTWQLVSSVGLSGSYERTVMDHAGHDFAAMSEPLESEDVAAEAKLAHRAEAFRAEGIRSLLGVPLRIQHQTAGSIAFYYRTPHAFTESEKRIAIALGNLAAAALGTAEVYERELASRAAAENAQRRAAFLARAGAVLSSSLDYEATLASVAGLVVPFFADWCAVDILTESGEVQRLAVQHVDAAKVELAHELTRRYPPRENEPARVSLKTGQSLLLEHIDDSILVDNSSGPEHLELMRSLGLKSLITAPLVARGRTLGVLTFVTESDRRYTQSDLNLAEELAARAATAVDNARLHREVLRSEEQLRNLVDSIPQLAWMAEPDGFIFWYNQRWYEFTGTTPEQMAGWGWKSVHDPEILPKVMERWQTTLRTGTPFEMEFPLRGADGNYGWFLTRVIPVRDGAGRVRRWFGTNTDITELKRIQEERSALLAREQEARSTAELLNRVGPTLLSERELNTLVQAVTDMATALTGAEVGAFFHNVVNERGESYMLYTISGVPREAFAKFPMPRNTAVFGPTFRGEGMVRSDDITQDPRYGKSPPHFGMPPGHLPVRSYLAAPVLSRSGEVLGGLLFGHSAARKFTDRHEAIVGGIAAQAAIAMDNARLFEQAQWIQAELQRSNQELRRANQDLETFAYSASHDLQEPLRNVAIYSQLLQRGYGEQFPEEAAKFLDGVVDGAVRMESLLNDLLVYSRATKPAEGSLPSLDANAILNHVLISLKTRIEQNAAVITTGELPVVCIHEVHLSQLFQNLISNALKYRSEEAPRVHIAATQQDGWWVFSVSDNGIGIDTRYRSQIFELFKRLHGRDQYPGSGVGLAICQRIVEQYGGRIWVERSEPGEGSIFCFTIPDRIRS